MFPVGWIVAEAAGGRQPQLFVTTITFSELCSAADVPEASAKTEGGKLRIDDAVVVLSDTPVFVGIDVKDVIGTNRETENVVDVITELEVDQNL